MSSDAFRDREVPKDFEDLKALVIARRADFPRRIAQVAEYSMAHPDEVAFGTAASVAKLAEVQPSTLVRYAQMLGYSGFSELQEVFRARLLNRWPDYQDRLQALIDRGAEGTSILELFGGFAESSVNSILNMRAALDAGNLQHAVDILKTTETVYLLGLRRAFPVASYLFYAFGKLGIKSRLVDYAAALGPEQISFATEKDALIAISFTPYTPETVVLSARMHHRGVPVISITDSAFSPLAATSQVWLEVAESDFGSFRSLAATFCLSMTLAVATAEQRQS